MDLQSVGDAAQVHATAVSADFAADAAGAELVWNWGLGLEGKFDAAALAASVEFPGFLVSAVDAGKGGGSGKKGYEKQNIHGHIGMV